MLALNKFRTLFLTTLISSALFACSSDDSQQSQTAAPQPATLSKSNAGEYSAALAKSTAEIDKQPANTTGTTPGTTDAITAIPATTGEAVSGIGTGISDGLTAAIMNGSNNATVSLTPILTSALPACTPEDAANLSGSLSVDNIALGVGDVPSYDINGSIDFKQYCISSDSIVSGIYLNGSILISGNQDTIDINFDGLTVSANGQIADPSCSFSFSLSGGATTDCNDIANTTFSIEDLIAKFGVDGIIVTQNADGSISVSVDGTVKTKDGYANVSTETPLQMCDGGGFSAGKLIISGSNNTQVSVDFTDLGDPPTCSQATWCIADPAGGEPTCDTFVYRAIN